MTHESRPLAPPALDAPVRPDSERRPAARRRWPLFAGLAVAVVVTDQVAKALVTGALRPGQSVQVVGDTVRIVFGQNTGALFGLFKDNALMFGIVSLIVVGLIVAYHARAGASLYLTVTLGLLLGGAIGNMIDRLRIGYVVDFVDVGIGALRFYTFNVADSAISLSILLLFLAAFRPSLVETHAGGAGGGGADRGTGQESGPNPEPGRGPGPEPGRGPGPSAAAAEAGPEADDAWDEPAAGGPRADGPAR